MAFGLVPPGHFTHHAPQNDRGWKLVVDNRTIYVVREYREKHKIYPKV